MTSRQRILDAIAHKQPDRVPIDLGSTPSSGISAIAYGRLKKHLGLADGCTRVYDVVQQLAQPEDSILDRFKIDVVDVARTFDTRDQDWYDVQLYDGSSAQYPFWFHPQPTGDGGYRALAPDGTEIAIQLQDMNYFDQTCFPYLEDYPADYRQLPDAMGKVHWQALAHSPWDHAGDSTFWADLRQNAIHLRQTTDRAIMIVCGCNLFEWGTFLRRMDNFLMDLLSEPEKVEAMLDALMERHLAGLAKVCEAVGDVVDIIRFGDDLGMDSGAFMSRQIYQQFFKPRHTKLCSYVKSHSNMHTFLHSCGSIHALLPDLIDAGFEVINPVQTNCLNMSPEKLKQEFGRDITFWGGGCDTREVLNHATPQALKDHVKRRLEIFSKGGGYVFNTVHNILPDVPPENIVAMYEAIEEFNAS